MSIGCDVATGARLGGAPDASNRTQWITVDKWITFLTALHGEIEGELYLARAEEW